MSGPFGNVYAERTVLVTGHTGFKGSWLSVWLKQLGADVVGYSLDPPTTPSNFEVCHLSERITDVRGDVRDYAALQACIAQHRPSVVFHLAAQPIVLTGYEEPRETFETNVTGTINLLEAVRCTPGVQAVVCVTTDKVYANREWTWGYREIDQLGGYDPYSASKAMAELAIEAYRRSFFGGGTEGDSGVALASARAGNVIGGGDWAAYRLVPDCMRALMADQPIRVRNPGAVRPWQHVLESLSGYLWLGAKLLSPTASAYAEAWNLGPSELQNVTTEQIVKQAIRLWGSGSYTCDPPSPQVETNVLRLNWEKAANRLQWRPTWNWEQALSYTVSWYKHYHNLQASPRPVDMAKISSDQIADYVECAREQNLAWSA
jgi:CDP-glucose 4,6-dehydratase